MHNTNSNYAEILQKIVNGIAKPLMVAFFALLFHVASLNSAFAEYDLRLWPSVIYDVQLGPGNGDRVLDSAGSGQMNGNLISYHHSVVHARTLKVAVTDDVKYVNGVVTGLTFCPRQFNAYQQRNADGVGNFDNATDYFYIGKAGASPTDCVLLCAQDYAGKDCNIKIDMQEGAVYGGWYSSKKVDEVLVGVNNYEERGVSPDKGVATVLFDADGGSVSQPIMVGGGADIYVLGLYDIVDGSDGAGAKVAWYRLKVVTEGGSQYNSNHSNKRQSYARQGLATSEGAMKTACVYGYTGDDCHKIETPIPSCRSEFSESSNGYDDEGWITLTSESLGPGQAAGLQTKGTMVCVCDTTKPKYSEDCVKWILDRDLVKNMANCTDGSTGWCKFRYLRRDFYKKASGVQPPAIALRCKPGFYGDFEYKYDSTNNNTLVLSDDCHECSMPDFCVDTNTTSGSGWTSIIIGRKDMRKDCKWDNAGYYSGGSDKMCNVVQVPTGDNEANCTGNKSWFEGACYQWLTEEVNGVETYFILPQTQMCNIRY